MLADLVLVALVGLALGREYNIEALAILAVLVVQWHARADRRRAEIAAMEPPPLGRWHYNDGSIRVTVAPDAESAIDRVLYPHLYVR